MSYSENISHYITWETLSIPEILIKGKPSDGGGWECWGGLSKKEKKERAHGHGHECGDCRG